jgi:hypothetical protein
MKNGNKGNGKYVRYHIQTKLSPDVEKWPSRFNVKVGKVGLAKLLLREIIHHGFKNHEVITSRPCMYGVFSGPVGGFAPRPQHCVACLRCTTEYPDFVTVSPNPARRVLGDSYFRFNFIDTATYEAETSLVPVKGAGYRGKFGGAGWDSMWTDMSEIVRPTRDGIHGREFISTVVDIGYTPNLLLFDKNGQPVGPTPHTIQIPLPWLFDTVPSSVANETTWRIYTQAVQELGTLAVAPLSAILEYDLEGPHVVPLVKPGEQEHLHLLSSAPLMFEMDGWDEELFTYLSTKYPEAIVALRLEYPAKEEIVEYTRKGIYVFHLLADFHGRGRDGRFAIELIRQAHSALVEAGIRQEVTLLGSGGVIAAEHIPKALLCGLDAVTLDTPLLVAMQVKFDGECADRESSRFSLPRRLNVAWGVQRLKNLAASWRDQLLEISGAMGLREIRRMRGEIGRAMFMIELEREAFAGVEGYER